MVFKRACPGSTKNKLMIKIIKEIVLTLCLFVVSPVMGANNVSSNEASGQSGFDWNPVIQAIVQVKVRVTPRL